MLTSEMVKKIAREAGADLVGIAPLSRLMDAPPETHPLNIYPKTKSVVVLAGRILEGSYKGVRENADWSTYWIYGYGTGIYGPLGNAMRMTRQFVESHGYETVVSPGGHTYLPHEAPPHRPPVAPGKMASNVVLHMRITAAAAGLGELGWGKVFLTPEFGPRQRFEMFLTDAELEPDPLLQKNICDRCLQCVRDCPGHALYSKHKKVSVTIEGRKFEWGDVDLGKCKLTHWGLNELASPFVKKDMPGFKMNIDEQTMGWFEAINFGRALSQRSRYLSTVANGFDELGQGGRPGSICGAYGCIQSCYEHLKSTGRIGKGKRADYLQKAEKPDARTTEEKGEQSYAE
jgi:Pyruvate/2-oxoacid:ferredoxin oxidoreductase delta subunit